MKEINEGIVYSNDIKLILSGYNNLDYNYNGILLPSNIENLRKDFKKTTQGIFPKVTIISEEDMISSMSNAIKDVLGIYPHCFTR
ncbi:MAG: hypothetical protein II625_06105 [Bacilli bacterium]|nr:hypothetical protein [Bacilli bacterium]